MQNATFARPQVSQLDGGQSEKSVSTAGIKGARVPLLRSILDALHHSRRLQAQRILRQSSHLIAGAAGEPDANA